MIAFDESEHPRDKDGKFTDKQDAQAKYESDVTEMDRKTRKWTAESKPSDTEKATMYRQESIAETTDSGAFHKAITDAKESNSPENRWRVDIHDISDYDGDKLFLTEGGSCVAVEPSGNIISVCKNQRDDNIRGKDLIKKAIENGGDRLDAFGKGLYEFYTRSGFEPVSWTPFNREYAPDGWKEEYGEEPVIFYKYTGKKTDETYEAFAERVKPSRDYDTAMSLRDREIKK